MGTRTPFVQKSEGQFVLWAAHPGVSVTMVEDTMCRCEQGNRTNGVACVGQKDPDSSSKKEPRVTEEHTHFCLKKSLMSPVESFRSRATYTAVWPVSSPKITFFFFFKFQSNEPRLTILNLFGLKEIIYFKKTLGKRYSSEGHSPWTNIQLHAITKASFNSTTESSFVGISAGRLNLLD